MNIEFKSFKMILEETIAQFREAFGEETIPDYEFTDDGFIKFEKESPANNLIIAMALNDYETWIKLNEINLEHMTDIFEKNIKEERNDKPLHY